MTKTTSERSLRRPGRLGPLVRWGALAASLLLAAVLIRTSYRTNSEPEFIAAAFLDALRTESARSDISGFLSRSQLFLLALMEEGENCAEDHEVKREIARRLIYQRKLLEPELGSSRFADLRPLLDEMELLFLSVADGQGCFESEEYELWRRTIEQKSTLMKLRLLQEKDRI